METHLEYILYVHVYQVLALHDKDHLRELVVNSKYVVNSRPRKSLVCIYVVSAPDPRAWVYM